MNEVFLKLINMSISASWLVLAVLLLRLLLKKVPKWVDVLLWGIVAVRLICPFSFESALSLIPSAETVPMNIELAAAPAIDSGIEAVNSIVNPAISASFTPDPISSANPLQIWIPILSVLWVVGMGAMLLYTAISYIHLRHKVRTAVLLRENVFQSEAVGSPFVLGIFRPRIYLPFNINAQDLQHVVDHEQAHIRRKDHWWKPLGFLLLTIHWFNPLMWLAYVLLCRDIELACDEKVIKVLSSEQRADYTMALLACSVSRPRIAACPLAFGEVGVKERVKSVMNYKKPAFWLIVLAVIVCIAVAVCFLTDPVKEDSSPEVPSNAVTFDAEILNIYDGYFLVAPVEGSKELNSAQQIEVPMQNMDPSLEPEMGDLIQIAYSGEILETYPGRLREVYSIKVIAEAQLWDRIPMVMVDGVLYLDTGIESNVDGRCGVMDGQITSTVDSTQCPTQNDQSNFGAGFDYQYGASEGTIEIYMNEKWWIFATEEARHNMHIPVSTAFEVNFAGSTTLHNQIAVTEEMPYGYWCIRIVNNGEAAIKAEIEGNVYRIEPGSTGNIYSNEERAPGIYPVSFSTAGAAGMEGFAICKTSPTPFEEEGPLAMQLMIDPVAPTQDNAGSFYLTIGAEGVTHIQVAMPGFSGGCTNADNSPFKKGSLVWIEQLDGCTDLRGLEISATDRNGTVIWSASVYADDAKACTGIESGDWVLRRYLKDGLAIED